jgi:hypothetical protein
VPYAFCDSDQVLTISTHERGDRLFPGTGFEEEIGLGAGRGRGRVIPRSIHHEEESTMRTGRDVRWAIVAVVIGALAGALGLLGPRAEAQTGPVKMEWLSWSHFRFTSPGGKVILTNPFVTNPDSPIKVADIPRADIILVADGHGDEIGSADEIAIKTGAKILAPGELHRVYFEPRKVPEAQLLRLNPGDRQRIDGITVRGVNAVHGSGTRDSMYGGPALGFMVQF